MFEAIPNLEMVHWATEGESLREIALSNGLRVEQPYETFEELYLALEQHGPLVIAGPKVDVMFVPLDGEFDGHVMALRQSGRNVRRFLVRSDSFGDEFGGFQGCVDRILSNNAIGIEIELKHLQDIAEALDLAPNEIDPERSYDRLEIDIIAALQMWGYAEQMAAEDEAKDFVFALGFCVGRLFSSAQNLATLEPDAVKARQYESSYGERGLKGKSKDRREKRLEHLFAHICKLVNANPDLSRMKPKEVARVALADACSNDPQLWTQGKGQLDSYLTTYASDEPFREVYRSLFPKTG
ncbi:MAG: hypothetical protein AAGJ50_06470 [Pseudomonadota bacterium]